MSNVDKFTWDKDNLSWNKTPGTSWNNAVPKDGYMIWENNTLMYGLVDSFTWDYVCVVKNAEKLYDGGTSYPFDDFEKKYKEDDLKKFIKVVCEVNGKIYSESRYKTVQKKLTIEDIRKTFNHFVNVRVEDI